MIAALLEVLDLFRTPAVNHPLFLAGLVFVAIVVLTRLSASRGVLDSWAPRLARATRGLAAIALLAFAVIAVFYVTDSHYFDSAEPTIVSIGWVWHLGHLVYPGPEATERYALIYGPMAFAFQGLALSAFGPSILVSKCVGVAAGLSSLVWLYFALPAGSRAARWTAVGLCALGFLLFRNYGLWTRPEPLQLLCVSAALVAAARGRGLIAALALGACSGVLWNLKITGPLYSLPIVAVFLSRKGWRLTTVALSAAVATAAAPFVFWFNVRWTEYLTWVQLSAGSGLQWRALLINVEWALFLLAPVLLLRQPAVRGRWEWPALVVGMIGIVVAASKPGAGAYHLLPFMPMLAWMAYPRADGRVASVGPMATSALIAMLLTGAALATAQQAQWIGAMISRRALDDVQDLVRYAGSTEGTIEMGYGSDEPLTLGRPVLTFHNGSYLLDQPAIREHQLAGIPIPSATIDAVRRCLVRSWLIPRGDAPFTARNVYPATRFAPLYSDEFRRAFLEHYRVTSSTTYFDVWQCRPAIISAR